jgi:hypothetical protein
VKEVRQTRRIPYWRKVKVPVLVRVARGTQLSTEVYVKNKIFSIHHRNFLFLQMFLFNDCGVTSFKVPYKDYVAKEEVERVEQPYVELVSETLPPALDGQIK